MSKIDNLLCTCAWLMHNAKSESGLDYMSRIDGENGAWYYWLHDVPGVYELKLVETELKDGKELSSCYLRYYPDLDEDDFEGFSCREQLVRLGELFDNNDVYIPEKVDVCPCCGGNVEEDEQEVCCHGHHHHHHEHHEEHFKLVARKKGIPQLVLRKHIPQDFFKVAELKFLFGEKLEQLQLITQNVYQEVTEKGVSVVDETGASHQVVAPGEVDRKLEGLRLSKRFYDFFVGNALRIVALPAKVHQEARSVGEKALNDGTNVLQYINATGVEKVIMTDRF